MCYKVFILLSTGKSLHHISTQPFSTTYEHHYEIISQGNGKFVTHTTCLKCHVQNKLTGSRRLYVTFKTYPFGYERLTDQDIKIVNMLVDLWKQLEKEFGRVTSRVRTSLKCKIWCIWKIIPLLLLFFTYLFIYLFILQGVKILFPSCMTSFKPELIVL